MTELKVGGSYVAKYIRTGQNEHGPYEMIIIQGVGKRQPTIGISVIDPPSGINLSGAFRVDEIQSTMVRNLKDRNGVWHTGGAVTVRARVTPVVDFSKMPAPVKGSDVFDTSFPTIEDLFK